MSVVTSLVTRVDSWINAMTGLGTLRDKLVYTQPVSGAKLGDGALESLFNDDDIARRICAKLPREAMRRGFRIELEGDDESEDADDIGRLMDDQLMLLGAIPKLRDSWIWARLYGGGCGVFVGADDGQSPEQPLNEAGIRTIAFLNVVKRPLITIKTRYEDVTSPQFGEPELYSVHVASTGLGPVVARASIDIHASRMILFDGAMTAQQTFQSPTGWQDSVLQNVYAALQQSATAWQSVAHLMTDASQGVLKIANLVDLIAAGGSEALRTRIQMMDMARSVARAILVDAEKESFERVSTSFAGLPEVMDKLMMRVAAAAEQPVTLLFGRSAAGMNATGESDIRGWYDTVSDAQTDVLKPRLERLLRLMFAAKDSPTNGRVPERWCVEFNPLWQPTDKELADTLKVKADTHVALVGAGIMTDAEAGIGLAQDFPTINVEHREELMEADLEEGLRPGEINAPTPEPDPNDPVANGGEGGSKGNGPKARTDAEQHRHPAGSPQGGQFAPASGATSAGRAEVGRRIEQEIGARTRRHDNTDVTVMIGVDYGGGAAHDARTGKVHVSEAHAALLAAPRPAKAGKLQEAYDRAAHIFVHEELHAYGPYPQSERRAHHPLLEEVTTDLVASRITGHQLVYPNNVQKVKDAIAQAFEVDDATAHEIASETSRKYKGHADAADDAHELFARLATTDPVKGSALAARLAKTGGGSPHEEPEAVDAAKKLIAPVRAWMKKQPRKDDWDERDDGWDTQTRAPKGSSIGGRWVGKGGGGTATQKKEARAKLTDAEREAIRAGVKSGSLLVEYQRRIVEKYGPGKGGMIAYERDIKARMKEAKAARAQIRAAKKLEKDTAEKLRVEKEKLAKAKAEADAKAKEYEAVRAKMALRAKATEKAQATRAANKAKKEAAAKAKAEAETKAKAEAKAKASLEPKPTTTLPPEHTVEHHAKKLEAKYGAAARTVAWGRAMHERGQALTLDELDDGIEHLTKHGATGLKAVLDHREAIRRVTEADPSIKTVGELATALRKAPKGMLRTAAVGPAVAKQLEGAAAVVAHRRALESSKSERTDEIKLKKPTVTSASASTEEEVNAAISGANKRYQALSHKDLKHPTEYDFVADSRKRGNCRDKKTFGDDTINIGAGEYNTAVQLERTTMHEWGHALEAENPELARRASAFLEARTKGEKLKPLGGGYDAHEVTRKDGFYEAYMGKEYRHPQSGRRYATEITSMGVENLVSGRGWGDFYKGDRDTAHFTLGQLANQ